ncbi:MAG: OsmC family protein [Pseudobdellovibrionaceae bacterium]
MVGMKATYEGELHCMIEHEPSGCVITTDAPKDNHGKGESFSPTDLLGAALSSCILTTMGIYAKKEGIDLDGAMATVTKGMSANPRRVGQLPVKVFMPSGIPHDKRKALEDIAHNCPVVLSLSKDIAAQIEFEYRETVVPKPNGKSLP